MTVKGFREARGKVIAALRDGRFVHEARLAEKNYLRSGRLSVAEAIALLLVCRGDQHSAGQHHNLPCDVHIFKPVQGGMLWYVKVYFLSDLRSLAPGEPDTMFVSVHPGE